MPRTINGSFIDHYMQYVTLKGGEVPLVWHKWSAITIISASLKRHVWAVIPAGQWKMYPNIYTLLVGRPGLGKGLAMNSAMDIIKAAKTANVLTGKITMPFVIELMAKGFSNASATINSGSSITSGDHSAFIHSSELSVFINAYKDSIELLTDIWDKVDDPFMSGGVIRGGKLVPNPSLNIIGGSAQEWLVKSIPHDAIGGGFTRRVNFVYANTPEINTNTTQSGASQKTGVPQNGFYGPTLVRIQGIRGDLVSTLQHISGLKGAYNFGQGVLPLLEAYTRQSQPDEFDDAATAGYITTKPAHAIKLAMALAASRSDSLVIERDDFIDAIALVDEVQSSIKIVFRAVGTNTLVEAGDKVLRFIEARGTVTEQQLLAALWKDLSRNDLMVILETFHAAGLVTNRSVGRANVWKLAYGVTATGVKNAAAKTAAKGVSP